MLRQFVIENNQARFRDEVNKLLLDGFVVVPGTMYAGSMEVSPDKYTKPEHILPSGKTMRPVYSVAVENENLS